MDHAPSATVAGATQTRTRARRTILAMLIAVTTIN
jgi:hypothetical protein